MNCLVIMLLLSLLELLSMTSSIFDKLDMKPYNLKHDFQTKTWDVQNCHWEDIKAFKMLDNYRSKIRVEILQFSKKILNILFTIRIIQGSGVDWRDCDYKQQFPWLTTTKTNGVESNRLF